MRDAAAALTQETPQSFRSISTSTEVPGGTHLNALKHGLYSEAILLPGDDVEAFRRQCLSLFHTYRPQTEDEAELVESLAEFRWLRQRCRPVQAQYDGQAVAPATDVAGRVCEPVGHQRLHSTIDVTKHRQRIERLWNHARLRLVEAQKMRRLGLVEGAVKLQTGCYMDAGGQVIGPIVAPIVMPIAKPVVETDKQPVTGLGDGGIGNNWEEKENGGEAGQANLEPGQAVLSGAALLGTLLQSTGSKLPARARPTGPELGGAVRAGAFGDLPTLARPTGRGVGRIALPGPSGNPSAPTRPNGRERRPDSRGRLIGGFGARRIFLEHPRAVDLAERVAQGDSSVRSRPQSSFSGVGIPPADAVQAGETPVATGSRKAGDAALAVPSCPTILSLTSPTPLPIVKNSAEMPGKPLETRGLEAPDPEFRPNPTGAAGDRP